MADVHLQSINPKPPTNLPDSLDGKVLEVVNGDLGNADTSYLYFPLVKAGYDVSTLQFIITATTLTIEVTNDRPEVLDVDAGWSDITSVLTGAPSITATGTLTVAFPLPWSRARIKRVTTNATNALTLRLTRGRF